MQEEDTALRSGSSSHLGTASQAENRSGSDYAYASQVAHTTIYAIKSRSNCFSLLISDSMEGNKMTGTEFVVMDEGSFTFETYGERVSSNKNRVICEVDNRGIISLSNKKLQLTEETFCSTLSTCPRDGIQTQMRQMALDFTCKLLSTRKMNQKFESDESGLTSFLKTSILYLS